MFFTFIGVFSIAFILQVISFPITISRDGPPQANQEGTPTHDLDCFYLVSFSPRVTSGRGRERYSTENLLATHMPPVSFTMSSLHDIDTLCRESAVLHAPSPDAHIPNEGFGTNNIVARSATLEVLENSSNKDLLEDGGEDLAIRGDRGGPIVSKKPKNGRNSTTSGVTINGGHGTAISGNAKIKLANGGGANSGNATTRRNGTATSGKVTINGGSGATAVSGDATSGDDGNSTSGSATNGGSNGTAISGDATSGDDGNATSGNAINSGSGGSAISGDATVNGTSSVDGESLSSASATFVLASATASPSTSSRHHTKAPVIIGSTIGSLVLVGILVLLAILWRRRKNRSKEGDTSEDEGLAADSRPGSARTSTISSSSTYPSPFEPIRRGGDFPLPSGDSLPQTRVLSPPTGSYWPSRVGNQSLERENLSRPAVEVVATTYGASPPPSYLSPQ